VSGSSIEYDVIVAGSGAGGGFAAMALTRAGMKVLLLERGPRHDYRTDYPMHHADWEQKPRPFSLQETSIAREPGVLLDGEHQHLTSHDYGHEATRLRRAPFRYRRVHGLGGTTLHYQGEAHRFADYAFNARTAYGLGADWPIGYSDLAPYYDSAEHILGVAGTPGNPHKPARGSFPTPAHPLSPASLRVAEAARQHGWTLRPNTLALPSRSVDGRVACQHTGGCTVGCIFGAKSSVDLTAIKHAEATGRLTVKTGAKLIRLETRSKARISEVVYSHRGRETSAVARAYVLATGAVETPRLLLASRTGHYPNGIGNDADQVGRYFMELMLVDLVVRYDGNPDTYKGPPIDARLWDFARPDPSAAVRSGYVLGVSGTMAGYQGPLSYALKTPGFGREHKRAMREQFGSMLSIFGIAEQEPRYENRLVLADKLDDHGVPLVSVRASPSAADVSALEAMLAKCRALADTSGAAEVRSQRSTYDLPSASHVGGGCRMGADPATSVTDPRGRVHGLENLYVCDASVLVSQGAGDSPSLTIQALALRTASHIARRLA